MYVNNFDNLYFCLSTPNLHGYIVNTSQIPYYSTKDGAALSLPPQPAKFRNVGGLVKKNRKSQLFIQLLKDRLFLSSIIMLQASTVLKLQFCKASFYF